jgi:hypothetical protein
MRGTANLLPRADPVLPVAFAALALWVADGLLAASVRPGAIAETSAAKAAVSAAAPAITQRRVRLTRARAASRIIAARARSLAPPPVR